MLEKARGVPADEVVVDLEDSVVATRKEEARAAAIAALQAGPWDGPSVAVRVNPPAGAWGADDVAALAADGGAALTCLVVPKVERADDLEAVDRLLGARRRAWGCRRWSRRPPACGPCTRSRPRARGSRR